MVRAFSILFYGAVVYIYITAAVYFFQVFFHVEVIIYFTFLFTFSCSKNPHVNITVSGKKKRKVLKRLRHQERDNIAAQGKEIHFYLINKKPKQTIIEISNCFYKCDYLKPKNYFFIMCNYFI